MPDHARTAGKYGMSGFGHDSLKLKFDDYLTDRLPTVPRAFGHISSKPPGNLKSWLMLANATYGCCVLSGGAHEEMDWAVATGKPLPRFTDLNIGSQYLDLTGGKDVGLDPVATAAWRQSHGLLDADGNVHRIKAFARINSIRELEYAVYLYGAAGVGFYLPQDAASRFDEHLPWDETTDPPEPFAGHYVPIVARNSKGLWVGLTWAEEQAISDRFLYRYCFDAGGGAIAYFSRAYLTANGRSPEAIDEAALDRDLNTIVQLPHNGA